MTDAASAVAWLLAQQEPEARRLAATQLCKVTSDKLPELLLRALSDEDWRVRKEASAAAATSEPRAEVIAALLSALQEKVNIGLRNAAVEGLIAIGSDAVIPAVEAFSRLDADGRKLVVEVLGGIADERGISALVRALVDDDPNVRSAAAESLGAADRAGPMARELAITALTAALGTDEVFLKLAALDALTRLKALLPWRAFEPFVHDSVLRRHAIATAARSDEDGALDALSEAVCDPGRTVAREAIVCLGERLGQPDTARFRARMAARLRRVPKGRDRVRALALGDSDSRVRGAAFAVLALYGDPDDIPLFIDHLVDDEVGPQAERALQQYGREAVGPLLRAARGEPAEVRAQVISLVPTLAPEADPELRDTLRVSIEDGSPEVVTASLRVLAVSGEASDIPKVAPLTLSTDARVASAAAAALSSLAERHADVARRHFVRADPQSDDATIACIVLGAIAPRLTPGDEEVRFLQRALASGSARTRRAALEALSALPEEVAGDTVAFALADEEQEVRLGAIRALGVMGHTEPLLSILKSDADGTLVAAALRALGRDRPEETARIVAPLLRSSEPAVACAACETLGRLGAGRWRDHLFEALEHPDPEVVKAALSQLATTLDARVVARIGTCLDHEAWEVRRLAAELLAGRARDGAPALLRARLDRERDPLVREALSHALSARPPGEE